MKRRASDRLLQALVGTALLLIAAHILQPTPNPGGSTEPPGVETAATNGNPAPGGRDVDLDQLRLLIGRGELADRKARFWAPTEGH